MVKSKRNKQLLTNRELDVLKEAKKILTNKEIAERLCISDHTVKAHIANVLHKLDAKNRYEAIIIASKLGYFTL